MKRREFIRTTAGALTAGLAAPAAMAAGEGRGGAKRPNILFFFPDQQRYDWTGAHGTVPVSTPHFDRIANAGAMFGRAFCASPVCAPSRACLASGKEYRNCRVASNGFDYPLDQTTFYTLLRESGYHVMGCGKFDLHKASPIWGLDGKTLIHEWGFSDGIDNAGKWDAYNSGKNEPRDPYMGYLYENGLARVHLDDYAKRRRKNYEATFPTDLPEEAYCDNWIGQNGLDLLRRAPKGNPWFIQINFAGPHSPMDITRRMEAKCRLQTGFPQPNRNTQFDEETHEAIRQNYSAMVTNIDRWLGLYIDELEKRGELENTLIVYGSDHGEMLGDHNLWSKSKPHQPSASVPLAIAGPGVKPGIRTDALVSLIDLTATFLDFAGLETPEDMDGITLRNVLAGRADEHREFVHSALDPWRMVFDGRYKYIESYGDNGPILFDLENDPLENANIAGNESGVANRLKSLFEA